MATNLSKLTNTAAEDGQLLGHLQRPFGQIIPFPAEADAPPHYSSGDRNGLGCAVAVRLVLGAELVVALAGYGLWRFLH